MRATDNLIRQPDSPSMSQSLRAPHSPPAKARQTTPRAIEKRKTNPPRHKNPHRATTPPPSCGTNPPVKTTVAPPQPPPPSQCVSNFQTKPRRCANLLHSEPACPEPIERAQYEPTFSPLPGCLATRLRGVSPSLLRALRAFVVQSP